jgi:hypothetical protein
MIIGYFCGHFGTFLPFCFVVSRKIRQPCSPPGESINIVKGSPGRRRARRRTSLLRQSVAPEFEENQRKTEQEMSERGREAQVDQIGRIFAQWAVVYFGHFFKLQK